jgi:hypothetical protein
VNDDRSENTTRSQNSEDNGRRLIHFPNEN